MAWRSPCFIWGDKLRDATEGGREATHVATAEAVAKCAYRTKLPKRLDSTVTVCQPPTPMEGNQQAAEGRGDLAGAIGGIAFFIALAFGWVGEAVAAAARFLP